MSDRRTRQVGSVLLTLALFAALVALHTWSEFNADFDRDGLGLYFFEALFMYLPLAAAVMAGQMAKLDMKALAWATAAVTILMVGQDFLPPSDITAAKRELVYVLASEEWSVTDTRDVIRWSEGGAFPLVARYLTGDLPNAEVGGTTVPEASPRIQVAWALFKTGYLLAGFIAVGVVVAMRVWVGRNLRFRTRGSERIFGFTMSWIVGPLIPLFLLEVAHRAVQAALRTPALVSILLPSVLFALAAGFGWRAGIRAEREAAYLDAIPVEE